MPDLSELRIQPAAETLAAARAWLAPVRAALDDDFVAAYLTGSVLTQGFDSRRAINLLLISTELLGSHLAAIARAIPPHVKGQPRFEPLFLTSRQIRKSLDVFPIEFIEIQERHLLLEGDDALAALEVPRTYLRLQLEHELRGKHIRLRQFLLANWNRHAELGAALEASASGFAALFRTLLRLQGESPPAEPAHVIQRVADVYRLDSKALLAAHLAKSAGPPRGEEALHATRDFVTELDRLIRAIDEFQVP